MSEIVQPPAPGKGNWDAYWRNAQSAAAHKDGGPQDVVLERFWMQVFDKVFPTLRGEPRMLDIACGNGAVGRFALASLAGLEAGTELLINGLDESPAALLEMRRRHPVLYGVAANAGSLPFGDSTFDLVTSQFGMEYAGPGVLKEAARIVCPGGVIAAVMHQRNGGIYKECANNLQAIDGFRQSSLLPGFERLYRAGITEKSAGIEDKTRLRKLDREFADSVLAAEEVLRRWGKGVASGSLFRLYTDIGHMYRRLANYEPAEVFSWIEHEVNELDTFAGRMASMLQAALDVAAFDQALADLKDRQCIIRVSDTLKIGQRQLESGWVIIAERTTA